MRRSIALISAAVTTFSLVILASVVYAYSVMAAPRPVLYQANAQLPAGEQVSAPAASAPAMLATVQNVSPQEAASVASNFLKRSDAYSVELASLNGTQCYKVAFSSGDVVYVSLTGQVLATVPAPAVVVSAPPLKKGAGAGSGNGPGTGRESGSAGGEGDDGGGEAGG
jgi:hypothetical protein